MKPLLNYLRRHLQPFLVDPDRQDQTIIFLSTSFFLVLVIFGTKPALIDTWRLYQEVAQGREIEKAIDRKIVNLNQAIENVNKVRTDLLLIDKALPKDKDLPSLLESLNLIFGGNSVILAEVRFGSPENSSNTNVAALPLYIQAFGSYESILAVLDELYKSPRQLDLTDISIEVPSEGDKRFLKVLINLEAYFLKAPNS